MSFNDAHAFAFSLAVTLMAAIVIFRAGVGTISVIPASIARIHGDRILPGCGVRTPSTSTPTAPTGPIGR